MASAGAGAPSRRAISDSIEAVSDAVPAAAITARKERPEPSESTIQSP